jgi:hypothetical protein
MPHEPIKEAVVGGNLRRPLAGEVLEVASLSPAGAHLRESFPPFLFGRSPRVVGRADPLHARVE